MTAGRPRHEAGGVLRRLLRYSPIRRPIACRTKDFKVYVRPDDWVIGVPMLLRRRYEPHVTAMLRRSLAQGDVYIDIGANIGFHALTAATLVGASGRVLAYEPSPGNCDLLRRSIRANDLSNLHVHETAVADRAGRIGYEMQGSNGRIGRPGETGLETTVGAVRLDDELADEPRIDVVKIDVEGAEGRVLRGMRQLLARHRPILIAEFAPRDLGRVSGIEPGTYLDELRALGYAIHVLGDDGCLSDPQENEELLRPFAPGGPHHVDLVAQSTITR